MVSGRHELVVVARTLSHTYRVDWGRCGQVASGCWVSSRFHRHCRRLQNRLKKMSLIGSLCRIAVCTPPRTPHRDSALSCPQPAIAPEGIYWFSLTAKAMIPLQVPGAPELLLVALAIAINLVVLIGFLGGLGYVLLRVRSGGSVSERLDRIERKVGRLEAQLEHLQEDD